MNILLLWLDPDFSEIYNTWEPSTDSKLSVLDAFWAKFDSTYREQVPQLTYRFNLRNHTQGEDEKIMVFINRITYRVSKCNYKSPEEHILEQLLHGTHMTMVREEVLDSNDTSLEYAKKIAHSYYTCNKEERRASICMIKRHHQK